MSNSSCSSDNDNDYLPEDSAYKDSDLAIALKTYQKAVQKHSFVLALKLLKSYPALTYTSHFTEGDSSDDVYEAIEAGAIEFVHYLIEELQVPLRMHKKTRLNLFEYAVYKGQINLLPFIREELCISKANPELLAISIQTNRFELFKYLVEEVGMRVEKPDSLLMRVMFINELNFLTYFYERLYIRQVSDSQALEVSLYMASITGDLAVLEYLVEKFTFCFDVKEVCPIHDINKYSLYNALNEATKRHHLHVLQFAVDVLHLPLKTSDTCSPVAIYTELLRTAVLVGCLPIFRYLLCDLRLDPDLISEEDNLILSILGLQDDLLKTKFLRVAERCISEEQIRWALEAATPEQLAFINKVPRLKALPVKRSKGE